MREAGLGLARLTVQRQADAAARIALIRRAVDLQHALGWLRSFAPLPRSWSASSPTTGYEDVRQVALARLLADNIPSIQVDWSLYGPKLAQVALTVGADDLDAVSALDDESEGRRRAPLEEVRRNIQAAAPDAGGAGRRLPPDRRMSRLRLGAVEYLNARPLVYGLHRHADRFDVRFDVPARCADLLHARRDRFRTGAVHRVPPGRLVRRGARRGHRFGRPGGVGGGLQPRAAGARAHGGSRRQFPHLGGAASRCSARAISASIRRSGVMPPEPQRMLEACDAALVIGDAALLFDHGAAGVQKTDLGLAWQHYAGLPFVYAFWFGRPGLLTADDIATLGEACRLGVEHAEKVARQHFPGDPARAAIGARYLRDNVDFGFAERELAGLTRFYREAADLGLVPVFREPHFA